MRIQVWLCLRAFAEYRGGKAGLLGFFVGQVMKASGGKANPASVNQLVAAALSAG